MTLPTTFTPDHDTRVCRYTGSGTRWDCAQSGYDASTVTRDPVTQFSDWAVATAPLTAVRLLRLAATARPGGLAVSWRTASELDVVGFRLYRARASSGPWVRLNRRLIRSAAPGPVTGARYSWLDRTAKRALRYRYRLAAIDPAGRETPLGSVRAPARR